MYLKVHQGQHVAAMLDISQRLENTANQLQEHLRFNHTSLRHAVEHLLIEVEQAQRYLYTEGPTIVKTVSKHFVQFASCCVSSLSYFIISHQIEKNR